MFELVFVYGSLKRGFHNSHCLGDSSFEGRGMTAKPEFRMGNVGAYPEVTRTESQSAGFVTGELYFCDQQTMARLDVLESNEEYYRRELVPISKMDSANSIPVDAWIYLWLKTEHADVVASGALDGHPIYEWHN